MDHCLVDSERPRHGTGRMINGYGCSFTEVPIRRAYYGRGNTEEGCSSFPEIAMTRGHHPQSQPRPSSGGTPLISAISVRSHPRHSRVKPQSGGGEPVAGFGGSR